MLDESTVPPRAGDQGTRCDRHIEFGGQKKLALDDYGWIHTSLSYLYLTCSLPNRPSARACLTACMRFGTPNLEKMWLT